MMIEAKTSTRHININEAFKMCRTLILAAIFVVVGSLGGAAFAQTAVQIDGT